MKSFIGFALILATGCASSIHLTRVDTRPDTSPWQDYNRGLRTRCLEENRTNSAKTTKALCDERDSGPTTVEEK